MTEDDLDKARALAKELRLEGFTTAWFHVEGGYLVCVTDQWTGHTHKTPTAAPSPLAALAALADCIQTVQRWKEGGRL
ncbi:hypothetical protein [uncultured Meiothermus sp.]|mgnify:CR=1 FL=1|uniref:hypothetical protein n=1 Tax=uncultured Meiothermus sp. TaxID=157471 RepID=UPI002627E7D6|nr:hypothetical protein [uncultured Meiothermus sp.]